jgi:thymidylate synthase
MKVITARGVNDAILLGLSLLKVEGVDRESRNGPVRVFPGPVTTHYQHPEERVLFHPERDANPYFHFMESLWMLSGRRDVEWISRFSSNIANYSDDGVTFHGAYGYRWRNWFGVCEYLPDGTIRELGKINQLATIANILKSDPDDRRVVLQMWDVCQDLGRDGKDFPCNVVATFRINPYGKLDMTVFNRSNDMIWGAYGANAVHFSMLQEVMASWIGVPMGGYWQVSTNFHSYHSTLEKHSKLIGICPGFDPYELGEVRPIPVVNGPIEQWFQDLHMFMEVGPAIGFKDKFFKKTAVPMLQSWEMWKNAESPKRIENAMRYASEIEAPDWRRACLEWLDRRKK